MHFLHETKRCPSQIRPKITPVYRICSFLIYQDFFTFQQSFEYFRNITNLVGLVILRNNKILRKIMTNVRC